MADALCDALADPLSEAPPSVSCAASADASSASNSPISSCASSRSYCSSAFSFLSSRTWPSSAPVEPVQPCSATSMNKPNTSSAVLMTLPRLPGPSESHVRHERKGGSRTLGRRVYDVRGAATRGGNMAVRVLIAAMTLVTFYGCGQSSPAPAESEKEGASRGPRTRRRRPRLR